MMSASLIPSCAAQAQTADRLPSNLDLATLAALPNHHPLWASAANASAALPPEERLDALTLVLSRSAEQEAEFERLLAEQQDPKSPQYRRWLTSTQIGERYGLSDQDISGIRGWLESQGLRITFIAPSRMFIGFGGTAAQIGKTFHTQMRSYRVHGLERISVDSDPMIPASLIPVVKGIRGLYTIDEYAFHGAKREKMSSPELTLSNGAHFLTPEDFATVYDVPTVIGGLGQTVGIVGRSRVDSADVGNFQSKTGTYFLGPTEIIPTAFGGVDPGPAYTAPPPAGTSLDDQLEATLDVARAGSIAPNVQLDLVVATDASGGIAVAAQYLVQTTPVPAQVMNISFGACESEAGPSGVTFWDTLFQQAAGEGISVFVSSGDAGASGCDANFGTPPASPKPNSPNYICSSSYATCLGGTEFNDASDAGEYWSSSNSSTFGSALTYIPEGAWNEPLNSNGGTQAAASAGGVSSVIATPSWQTGTGVPSARSGRYTPDLAFSASGHDGYFACFAAAGASCVADSNGEFQFEYFYGTSAAAPDMAGITALLNEKVGIAQGNLNPQLYALAAGASSPFHDVTVASSGVSGCSVQTPSMCNNSIPGPTGLSGGQVGYLIGDGYDEVTGLGSLDVAKFFNAYIAPKTTPTLSIPTPSPVTTAQIAFVEAQLTGRATGPPTGTAILSGGGYNSAPVTLSNGYAEFQIPADVLTVGTDVLTVDYTPDQASAAIYNATSGTTSITVTTAPIITPVLYLFLPNTSITSAQDLQVEISLSGGVGDTVPTGTLNLASGTYNSGAVTAGPGGLTYITVRGQDLAAGTDTLTATYTPDSASAKIYKGTTSTATVTVTKAAKITPTVLVSPVTGSITTAQSLDVQIGVGGGNGDQGGTGTITLTAATFTSAVTPLNTPLITITVPAGALPAGTDTLTANYTPDTSSSAIYTSATGSATVMVTAAVNPAFAIAGTNVSVKAGAITGNTSTVTVTPSGGFTGTVALTAAVTSSPAGAVVAPTLSFGSTGSVIISGTGNGTATLTVSTTDGTVCGVPDVRAASGRSDPWFAAGGVALASLLMLGFPARRKRVFPALLLLAAAVSAIAACGGGGGKAVCNVATPGTTSGTYTITISGASGSTKSTGNITLIVQ